MLSATSVKPPQLDEFYSVAEAPLRAAGIRGPRVDRGNGVGQRRRRPGIGADPFSADRSLYNRICPLLQRGGLFAGHGAAALTVSRKPVLLG